MAQKTVTVPFKPHPYQQELLNIIKRFSVFVCHRRFGKSTLMINWLIRYALKSKRKAWRGAYIGPYRKQTKDIAWDYLLHYTSVVPGAKANHSELKLDFPNGARISLFGADDPDSLRGPYWDAVVFDEYAQIRPRLWPEIIRPALTDRKGWAIFIGTPKGHNHFYELWNDKQKAEDWATRMYKASQTTILDPNELEKAREELTPEQYEQEFECSFESALMGAYYGTLVQDAILAGRVCGVPYDPILPVHTAWDIGVDDQTAIVMFQIHKAGEIRIIDYHEENGFGIDHYVKVLAARGYVYGSHLAPHDIKARSFAAMGRSAFEVAESLGLKFVVVPSTPIMDGIQAVRSILPRCYFDQAKAEGLIEILKTYRKEYSEMLSTFRDRPLHDWSSHGADAVRTMATGLEFIEPTIPVLKIKTKLLDNRGVNAWML